VPAEPVRQAVILARLLRAHHRARQPGNLRHASVSTTSGYLHTDKEKRTRQFAGGVREIAVLIPLCPRTPVVGKKSGLSLQPLLKYISDVDLRRFINAETNKSEQFNNFLKLIFFGNGGLIAENVRHEQQKVMKFAHLVANMLIVYTVHDMERVIRELRDEGFPITPELLADLNPYRLGHVNMLGDYAVDRRRRVTDLIVEPILGKRTGTAGAAAVAGAA